MKKPFQITLRINLAASFMVIVFLACILVGLIIFLNIRGFVRNGVRERLRDAAAVAVLTIDATAHAQLVSPEDESGPSYIEIKKSLQAVRRRLPNARFIYTMRKTPDGEIVFVVDSEESVSEMSHIGDPYQEPSEEMLAAFRWPYEIQVEREFTSDEWGEVLSSYAPFFTGDGKLEGIVGVDMLAGDVLEYERRLLVVISTASLISSLFIALVGVLYSRTISGPILHISKELSRVRDLDLERIAPTPTRLVEIARMSDVLMDVKNSLGSFRKYVPSALVTELMQMRKEAALEGERRTMTIFFSDIANFTSISERLTPEELVERLGIYLGEATEIILAEQGTVDKYIGDSVMAFWGAPKELTDHAARACLAALQTSRAVRRLANEWSREDFPEFEVRIGIATGDVVVGNVGYEKRMDYTVLGDNVNLASRLEGLNKYYGTRILISESTRMAARDRIETRLVDHVAVKGKSKGLPVFELLGEKDSLSRERLRMLDLHEESMDHYLNRRWDAAAAGFESILGQIPGDQLTTMLLNRCREFALTPPPEDWTGVVVMRNK